MRSSGLLKVLLQCLHSYSQMKWLLIEALSSSSSPAYSSSSLALLSFAGVWEIMDEFSVAAVVVDMIRTAFLHFLEPACCCRFITESKISLQTLHGKLV